MTDQKTFTAHVPTELAERVDRFAQARDRSRGWVIKQALEDWVRREDERYNLTLEALESAQHGDLISQEEMDAWAEGLDEKASSAS